MCLPHLLVNVGTQAIICSLQGASAGDVLSVFAPAHAVEKPCIVPAIVASSYHYDVASRCQHDGVGVNVRSAGFMIALSALSQLIWA